MAIVPDGTLYFFLSSSIKKPPFHYKKRKIVVAQIGQAQGTAPT
jgi:hypothetical protein